MTLPNPLKGERIRDYFRIEADLLQARYRMVETLLPSGRGRGSSHAAEEGRHIESLLRDFLNRHLPAGLRAFSGFILRPATKTGVSGYARVENEKDRHSRQLDVIVYEVDRYPVYERFEEFAIVPPEGVVGIVSVKKCLRVAKLASELESLREAAAICERESRMPYLGLFGFSADKDGADRLGTAIFDKILSDSSGMPFDALVNEVSVLDRLTVFKVRPDHSPEGAAGYVRVDCVGEPQVTLQRMVQSILSVYYDPSRWKDVERPGYVSFHKGQFRNAPRLGDVPSVKRRRRLVEDPAMAELERRIEALERAREE